MPEYSFPSKPPLVVWLERHVQALGGLGAHRIGLAPRLTWLLMIATAVVSSRLSAQSRPPDTTFIKASRQGAWGAPRQATEELRVSKVTDAGHDLPFDIVGPIATTPSGGVIVWTMWPGKRPELMQFDSTGRPLGTIGEVGFSPGGFGTNWGNPDLAVSPDGTIYFGGGQWITAYSPKGEPKGSLVVDAGLVLSVTIVPDSSSAGGFYLGMVKDVHHAAWENDIVFEHFGRNNPIDSIMPPHFGGFTQPTSAYQPREFWRIFPDGRFVLARSDQVGFVLETPHGARSMLRVTAETDTVRYLTPERAELQSSEDWIAHLRHPGTAVGSVQVPLLKQPLSGIRVDPQGRIWLQRATTGIKRVDHAKLTPPRSNAAPLVTFEDALRYSVFEQDGKYLGEILFPPGVLRISSFGSTAWGIARGSDGHPSLVKFRLPAMP